MFFPDFLYQLSQRDQQVTWLDPALSRIISSVAAATVTADFIVPNDRMLLLSAFYAVFSPGAAQNVVDTRIELLSQSLVSPAVILTRNSNALAAGIITDTDRQCEIPVPPLWRVRATGVFNAGAAANDVHLSIAGMLIPIGNIQRL